MPETVEQITSTIAALEAQRAILGDAVVDVALAPLRRELAARSSREPQPAQQLKQVSVLFVDVVGSTSIGQQLGPEEIHAVMDTALERFTSIVQAHHGRVLQYTGDGMLAAFGSEEAERREHDGTMPNQLEKFGNDLSDWLRNTHPDLPQMKGRSIQNIVRDIWRRKTFNSPH